MTWAGCVMSLSGAAAASLEGATVKSLRDCTMAGPWAVAMKEGAFGGPGRSCLSQKIEPITAAPTRTSAETLTVQAPERRPVDRSIPFGPFENKSSDSRERGGSTSTAPVPLGLLGATPTDGLSGAASRACIGPASIGLGFATVSAIGGERSASPEDSTSRTNSASSSSAFA
ncbi:MAG TPA: hypothetical protein VFE63_16875 [Roseiarcus sp.]|nr:hypothetical protein [Roseiarcus sp.]